MGQNPSTVRREVEEAREHLGDTVEAIAYRANAPRRAKERAAARFAAARRVGIVDTLTRVSPHIVVAVAGLAAGIVLGRRLRSHT
jgi:hypothetical protein